MSDIYVMSLRSQCDEFFYDLVWEWEDEMVKGLTNCRLKVKKEFILKCRLPLKSYSKKRKGVTIMKLLEYYTGFCIDRMLISKAHQIFHFDMSPQLEVNSWNQENVSVVIIDFYLTPEELPAFWKRYGKVNHLYVSNLQVLSFLNNNNPQRLVEHCPLSLPDKYAITKDTHFEKKYDVVMIGRQNPVLKKYLEKYRETHDLTYALAKPVHDGHSHAFTDKGESVGDTDTREQYIEILKMGRVVLYSTSGMDNDRVATNGFHQVTPKFLEALACGCHVISRFDDNEDTDFYELRKMSSKVESYADFEAAMDRALATPVDMEAYSHYLAGHYTTAVSKKYLAIFQE